MKIVYFAHDLSDPAVARRIAMLRTGGAEVRLLGFRRTPDPIPAVAGVEAVDLGQTFDGRLGHRAGLALRRALLPLRFRQILRDADVVVARNLEMLMIAARARAAGAPKARLVYECLDIHRAMLGTGLAGKALRGLERSLLARSDLLMVSSPAFVEAYFKPRQHLRTPVLLVENKVFEPTAAPKAKIARRPAATPWRIGWFGIIRCRRSLDMLSALCARNPGQVEVVIRGRPAYQEFDDFQGLVGRTPGLSFEGAYRPEDLPRLYADVHFTWAIDYFDAGQNSEWLLQNRLYEGALHGSVSLAAAGTESARWVASHQAGVVLDDPAADAEALLSKLTPSAYAALSDAVGAIPRTDLAADAAACRELVRTLAGQA